MTVALIVAAGSGERLGAGRPRRSSSWPGARCVQWSIDALRGVDGIERIVVALPAGRDRARRRDVGVEGGAVRSDSVRRALAAAGAGDGDPVLVHDAARPLLTRRAGRGA